MIRGSQKGVITVAVLSKRLGKTKKEKPFHKMKVRTQIQEIRSLDMLYPKRVVQWFPILPLCPPTFALQSEVEGSLTVLVTSS